MDTTFLMFVIFLIFVPHVIKLIYIKYPETKHYFVNNTIMQALLNMICLNCSQSQ